MTARIPGAVMGRPSNARLAELAVVEDHADMRDEFRALLHERGELAVELGYWSTLLVKAVRLDRDDMIHHAAGRLAYLSTRLTRQNDGGAA